MANVVKKYSISSELAQKMVDAAVAKAREIGVSENVAILDDGGNLKAFSRMDEAPILCIEMALNKAYTALFGVSTQDFFNFIQRDPSMVKLLAARHSFASEGSRITLKKKVFHVPANRFQIRSTIIQSYARWPVASSTYAFVDPHFHPGVPSPVANKKWVRNCTDTSVRAVSPR